MTEATPEPADPVVALLEARRSELLGGEDSIAVQEARVDGQRASLDLAVTRLAACQDEVARIDAALALLRPAAPVEDVP